MLRRPPTHLELLFRTKPVTEQDVENELASRANEQVMQRGLDIFHIYEFFWQNGERYVYGPDIGYYDTKVLEYKEEWNNHDCYYVSTMETTSLSYVDRPKPNSGFVTHMSERQWHLPRNHLHHLLNFPQEILDLILDFTLVIKDHTVTPDVTLSNKRSSYKISHSYTLDGKRYEPPDFYNSEDPDHPVPLSTIITKKYHDSKGAYFMIHRVYRPVIDATILRVCKTISVQGTRMLYEKNVFQFSMTQINSTGCPGYLAFGKVYKDNVTLKHYTRRLWSYNPDGYFLMAIHAIETQVSTYDLEDYLYHDHFIRFLHVIGPAKAAMIKKLHFHGRIVTHRCKSLKRVLNCEEDLYESLHLYIPLINKFCTSLQTMEIGIGEDKMYFPIVHTQSRAIVRFKALNELLRTLKTVRRLDIYQLKEAKPTYNIVEPGPIKIVHTFPELHRRRVVALERNVTRWFKERADKWEHEENERQKILMTLETPPPRGEES
ncbi:uncharacterized protein Bfra_009710 [Botrytis fragariae]|uniref:Uncharacterized protein n=1 Tax=Botrytis fragariae TaxID=1964551 RepID=A0A8H6AMI7_9HELO|nr:uncharacterized protein Bfra_009710 [Botrytis fragariae]KAF5870326.1 hypothetical protein Bfra_009710 [Botrytis fragariae]